MEFRFGFFLCSVIAGVFNWCFCLFPSCYFSNMQFHNLFPFCTLFCNKLFQFTFQWRTRSEKRSLLNSSCFIKHFLEELERWITYLHYIFSVFFLRNSSRQVKKIKSYLMLGNVRLGCMFLYHATRVGCIEIPILDPWEMSRYRIKVFLGIFRIQNKERKKIN